MEIIMKFKRALRNSLNFSYNTSNFVEISLFATMLVTITLFMSDKETNETFYINVKNTLVRLNY